MTELLKIHHGMAKAKGCGHVAVGSFSRLFPDLPNHILSEEQAAALGGPGGLMHDFDDASPDSNVPAAYIFFAQFVDHDITLDTTSALLGKTPLTPAEVEKLPNVRSASLDLDCVYGFGPDGSPHLYDAERPGRLGISPNGFDLPRSPTGIALIGDPRNDENIFIAQIQLLFHQLHNRIYTERVRQTKVGEKGWSRFEAAQRETRYHYQWIVLFDFLKRICDPEIFAFAAGKLCDPKAEFPLCYGLDGHHKLPMPVEFSTAAYRIGHTMVRNLYAVNAGNPDVQLFDERFEALGFKALPESLALDWRFMLQVAPHLQPRMAKAFDPLLANELQDLPVVASNNPNLRALAFRNLMRASALGVPSGQDVAAALKDKGYPLEVCDLELETLPGWWKIDAVQHKGTDDLRTHTPLFYYILRESELKSAGERLGPTGSAILMEVFGGMLRLCGDTFIRQPDWRPDVCIAKDDGAISKPRLISDFDYYPLELADLVRYLQS